MGSWFGWAFFGVSCVSWWGIGVWRIGCAGVCECCLVSNVLFGAMFTRDFRA